MSHAISRKSRPSSPWIARGENMIKASTFDSPYQIAFTNGEQASVAINLQTKSEFPFLLRGNLCATHP